MKKLQTNLVIITKDNTWYRIGEVAICLVTDDEYEKLSSGTSPKDIDTVAQMAIKNITHKDVGALLF